MKGGDKTTVPAMEQKEKMSLCCKEKCRTKIFQLGSYKTPMGLRQAQFSETQLLASLNFTWKSKTIISRKTIKCNMGITYTGPVDQLKCPWSELLPLGLTGRGPCRRTQRSTQAEHPFLWDSLLPSCSIETCIQQVMSGPLPIIATNGPLSRQCL